MKWGLTKKQNNNVSLSDFDKRIERLFDNFFSFEPTAMFDNEWNPSIDVDEDSKAVYVNAELPGMDEKNIDVSIEGDYLTISGEKKESNEKKGKKGYYCERRFGSFSRTIALPEGINFDDVKANFKKGVLKIELPKSREENPKQIKINVK